MPLKSVWSSVRDTLRLLVKAEKFEWMNESMERVRGIDKSRGSRTKLVTYCVIKIRGHQEFRGEYSETLTTLAKFYTSRGEELLAVKYARRECLKKIRETVPDIFDGLGIEALRG